MNTRKMVSLPDDLWQAIDEFRFKHRYRVEAEAIRRLIELGLKAEQEKPVPDAEAEPQA